MSVGQATDSGPTGFAPFHQPSNWSNIWVVIAFRGGEYAGSVGKRLSGERRGKLLGALLQRVSPDTTVTWMVISNIDQENE
jgi:hypothetical protein